MTWKNRFIIKVKVALNFKESMQNKKVIIIGIAGPAASGKSLLASKLAHSPGEKGKIVTISADNYYKDQTHISLAERAKVNYDHPSSIDNDLICEHIELLKSNKAIEVPQYDYKENSRKSTTTEVEPHEIIVLEGILTLAVKSVRSLMDIKIYVDTPLDICLTRRIKRDVLERGRKVDHILEQYTKHVRPMFLKYIEPSKKYAHIIVPRGGKNKVALDIIKSRISELLKK